MRCYFAVLTFLIAGALSGCASLNSPKEDVAKLEGGEGLVVGSVLITTDETPVEDEADGKLFGKGGKLGPKRSQKAAACSFAIRPFDGFFSYTFGVRSRSERIRVDKEYFFAKKMSEGQYIFGDMVCGDLKVNFFHSFDVRPQQATYLGKFVLVLPKYLYAGQTVSKTRVNEIESAKKYIARDFPDFPFPLQPQPGLK